MAEETEVKPSSKKGKVRAEIAQMILDEIAMGKLEALIARSADFFGPGIKNSVLNEMTVKNFKAGKKANWFCTLDAKHNFTYTTPPMQQKLRHFSEIQEALTDRCGI